MNLVLLSAVVLGGLVSPPDTLVDLRRGDVLVLEQRKGSVQVETWDRPLLSLEGEEGGGGIRVRRSGSRVEIRSEEGPDRATDLRIVMPRWGHLEITGREMEVKVRGVEGDVVVRNLDGDVRLEDVTGEVFVRSVEGTVEGEGLTGEVRIETGNGDIRLRGVSGRLELETVDGEVRLRDVASTRISLETTDGDVDFLGRFLPGGHYSFVSHGGDMVFSIREPVDLDVSALVYDGDFRSDFPVRARGFRSGEEVEFTIGGGGARVSLKTFDGDVTLRAVR